MTPLIEGIHHSSLGSLLAEGAAMFDGEPSEAFPTRIVIVDDMEPTALLVAAILETLPGATTHVFARAADALEDCLQDPPDLVLLDYFMPGMDGLAFITALRAQADDKEIPVIMVTADTSADTLRRAFEAGVTDFLRKPVDETELMARSRNLLRLHLRQLALQRANENLTRLANNDALTGVLNRRYFLETAAQEITRAYRYEKTLSLIVLDLDHFKSINDTYGHAGGDATLVAVTEACRQCLRDTDSLGRLGGEEFVILLTETPMPQAADAAERVRQAIAECTVKRDTVTIHVTASLGVAQWAGPGESLDALVQRADEAMYRAKHKGRNRVIAAHMPRSRLIPA